MPPTILDERRNEHLVETAWLAEHLADSSIRVVDVRGYVRTETQPDGYQRAEYLGAYDEYAAGHIPGAIYMDWTRDIVDLTDSVPAQVAPAEKIAALFGDAGIGDNTLVVAYDHHPASQFATRLWWVLRYYGHDRVRVLDGGLRKWLAERRPVVATGAEAPETAKHEPGSEARGHLPAVFTPVLRPELRVTAEQVLAQLHEDGTVLVDARDIEQYEGSVRRGPRGGHIPGAIHLPREALFAADGTFLPPSDLQRIVDRAGLTPGRRTVAYCNGGVAATSVLFALSMLGFPKWTNYDGSWNEWGARQELPVESGR